MAEIIKNVNPKRIQWCQQQVATDIAELVKKGIPERKLESGALTYIQLKKIAEYFGYSPLFFLEPEEPETEKILSANFRTLANQSIQIDNTLACIIKRTEWHRDLYIGLAKELEEEISYASPQMSGTITQKANTVRRWLGIDDAKKYTFDSYRELVETKGILVFRSMRYNGNWQLKNNEAIGFSITHPQAPLIFIRKTSPQMQTFTLFHELGHLLLHSRSCIDNQANLSSNQSDENEREANQFAAGCLLPNEIVQGLSREIPEGPESYDLEFEYVAEQRGISVEVVVVALLKQGMISQSDYYGYKGIKGAELEDGQDFTPPPRAYRYKEPLQIFGYSYVATVLSALHADKVTLSKASDYLDRLKIGDVKRLDDSL